MNVSPTLGELLLVVLFNTTLAAEGIDIIALTVSFVLSNITFLVTVVSVKFAVGVTKVLMLHFHH